MIHICLLIEEYRGKQVHYQSPTRHYIYGVWASVWVSKISPCGTPGQEKRLISFWQAARFWERTTMVSSNQLHFLLPNSSVDTGKGGSFGAT